MRRWLDRRSRRKGNGGTAWRRQGWRRAADALRAPPPRVGEGEPRSNGVCDPSPERGRWLDRRSRRMGNGGTTWRRQGWRLRSFPGTGKVARPKVGTEGERWHGMAASRLAAGGPTRRPSGATLPVSGRESRAETAFAILPRNGEGGSTEGRKTDGERWHGKTASKLAAGGPTRRPAGATLPALGREIDIQR